MVKRVVVAVVGLVVLAAVSCSTTAPSGRVLDPSSTTTGLATTVPPPVTVDPTASATVAAGFPFCPGATPVLAVVAPIPKGMTAAEAVTSGRIVIATPGDKWRPSTALASVAELEGSATYDIGVGTMLVGGSFTGTAPAPTGTPASATTGTCTQPDAAIADVFVAAAPLAAGTTLAVASAAGSVRSASLPRSLAPAEAIVDLTANGPKVFAIAVPPGTVIVPALFR